MSDRNIVIFARSGLSKSLADIPIQDEFLPAVLDNGRKEWVLGPLPEKEADVLEKWQDSEMLLSYLYYQDMLAKEQGDRTYKKSIINFRMAMNEYFLQKPEEPVDEKTEEEMATARKNFNSLLDYIQKNSKTFSIVTTNYDLEIEKYLKGKGNYDYSYMLDKNQGNNATKLLKLHGSINWLEERNHDDSSGELYKKFEGNQLLEHVNENLPLVANLNEDCFTIDDYKCSYYMINSSIYTPITIPFFFQKEDWYSMRWGSIFDGRIWEEARNVLRNATHILFIGLGLARADTPLLGLFNSTSWWQKKIIILGKNAVSFEKNGIVPSDVSKSWLQDMSDNELRIWLNSAFD